MTVAREDETKGAVNSTKACDVSLQRSLSQRFTNRGRVTRSGDNGHSPAVCGFGVMTRLAENNQGVAGAR